MDDSQEDISTPRDPNMPEDALGLGLDMPVQPALASAPSALTTSEQGAYRVLARKYRPQSFSELIGQEAMVRTLGNAIKRDRLAHAFLMTGVRGVGKTSTARLIAKALNCIGPDGQGGPTIDPCGVCEPCTAIAEGRHIDVIEMDAASNTGVDDVREIIEAVRYAAVSARYKIYIIDEVHMLSRNAFNALLKTLEEPPGHVKFIFATTEVNKVPVTVLSRCQRFDLKRIPVTTLEAHFAQICMAEHVEAEPEALRLVAQAAEGSVRDGLSILDQAIAHADLESDGKVEAARMRDMLGLADRGAIRRLLGIILSGEPAAMLDELKQQHALGVEPTAIMVGLLGEVHRLSLAKIGSAAEAELSPEAQQDIESLSAQIGAAALHRLWQMLLKGHEEVGHAPHPQEACDMALLRVMHAATMPDPGELARMIAGQQGQGSITPNTPSPPPEMSTSTDTPASTGYSTAQTAQQVTSSPVTQPLPKPLPSDFLSLLERLADSGSISVEMALRDTMRVVDYAPPRIAFQWSIKPVAGFSRDMQEALFKATATYWQLDEVTGDAPPSLLEQEKAAADVQLNTVMQSPIVKAAFTAFPDAQLLDIEDEPIDRRSVMP